MLRWKSRSQPLNPGQHQHAGSLSVCIQHYFEDFAPQQAARLLPALGGRQSLRLYCQACSSRAGIWSSGWAWPGLGRHQRQTGAASRAHPCRRPPCSRLPSRSKPLTLNGRHPLRLHCQAWSCHAGIWRSGWAWPGLGRHQRQTGAASRAHQCRRPPCSRLPWHRPLPGRLPWSAAPCSGPDAPQPPQSKAHLLLRCVNMRTRALSHALGLERLLQLGDLAEPRIWPIPLKNGARLDAWRCVAFMTDICGQLFLDL